MQEERFSWLVARSAYELMLERQAGHHSQSPSQSACRTHAQGSPKGAPPNVALRQIIMARRLHDQPMNLCWSVKWDIIPKVLPSQLVAHTFRHRNRLLVQNTGGILISRVYPAADIRAAEC